MSSFARLPLHTAWLLFAGILNGQIFSNPVPYTAGGAPVAVVAGDFNGDGRPDLAVANQFGSSVSILLQANDGSFFQNSGGFISLASPPIQLAAADFNVDGKLDLAITTGSSGPNRVMVLLGDGAGSFSGSGGTLIAGNSASGIAVGDFNRDLIPDLAVTNRDEASITAFLGGISSFSQGVSYAAGSAGGPLITGDFNGDGVPDLLAATSQGQTATLLTGTGAGTFAVGATPIPLGGENATALTAGDYNEDGRLDFAVTLGGSDRAGIFLGNGSGGFAPAESLPTNAVPAAATTADFNGDGHLDIAVATYTGTTVHVFSGDGGGRFSTAPEYSAGGQGQAIFTADFDLDGRPDIVTANPSSDTVSVLLNILDYNFFNPHYIVFDGVAGQTAPITIASALYSNNPVPFTIISSADWLTATPGCTGMCVTANPAGLSPGTYRGSLRASGTATSPRFSYVLNATLRLAVPAGTLLPIAETTWPTGMGDQAIRTADFNGDGRVDIALTNGLDGTVVVLLGEGSGTFVPAPGTPYAGGRGTPSITIGDLNNDKRLDIAVTDQSAAGIIVLLASANGGFAPSPFGPFPTSGSPQSVATADFNRDGNLDVIVSSTAQVASIHLGNGFGGLAPAVAIPSLTTGPAASYIHTGDFNGDRSADVAFLAGGSLIVYRYNEQGSLLSGSGPLSLDTPVASMTMADVNADATSDIVIATADHRIGVLLGNREGLFTSPVYLTLTPSIPVPESGPLQLAVADFDGDGKLDLAVASGRDQGSVAGVYLGPLTETFLSGLQLSAGSDASAIATGDFNGDGREDVAISSFPEGVRVYLGDQTPTTTVFSPNVPSSVTAGQPLAVTAVVSVEPSNAAVLRNPAGTVTFFDGSTELAAIPLGDSTATYSFNQLSPGTHTLRAVYNHDTSDPRTRSSMVSTVVNVGSATTSVTFSSVPPGAAISIDGAAARTAPFTIALQPGEHSVSAPATFAGSAGVQHVFTSWSDDATMPGRTITVGSSDTTYTAAYQTQYELTISAVPSNGGIVTPASGFYNAGSTVALTATANPGFTFSGWTGFSANPSGSASYVTATSPLTIVAAFSPSTLQPPALTLSSSQNPSPYGRPITLAATFAGDGFNATGSVRFYDGITLLGTANISDRSSATLTNVVLPAGTRRLRAYFPGDRLYSPAASQTLSQRVNAAPAGQFVRSTVSVGGSPGALRAADINSDGLMDLVVVRTDGLLLVFPGTGDGTFRTPSAYDVPVLASSIAVGDFNRDASPDVAIGTASQIAVLLNRGDGSLVPAQPLSGTGPLAVADFNDDGRLDIVSDGSLVIRYGQGDGSFQEPIRYALATPTVAFAIDDFNRDLRPDIVAAVASSAENLFLFTVSGSGTLNQSGVYSSSASPGSIASGDLNADGNPDLIVVESPASIIRIFLGTADGTFRPAPPIVTTAGPGSIAMADMDANETSDIVLASSSATSETAGNVTILSGLGDGNFQAGPSHPAGASPTSPVIGDFNGDSVPDVVVLNSTSESLTVLLGQPGLPVPSGPPVITADILPRSATQGEQNVRLTITGTSFCSESRVFWNSTSLPATAASDTRLTAEVPPVLTASPGTARISVVNPSGAACGPGGTSNPVYFVVAAVLAEGDQALVVQKIAEQTFPSGSTTPIVVVLPVTTTDGQPPAALQAAAVTVSGNSSWLRVTNATRTSVEITLDPANLGHGTFVGYVTYSTAISRSAGSKAPLRSSHDCSQVATVVEFSDQQPSLRFSPASLSLSAIRLSDSVTIDVDPNSAAAGTIVPIEVKSTTAEGAGGPCWLSFSPAGNKAFPLQTGDAVQVSASLGPSVVSKPEPYQGRLIATAGADAEMARIAYSVNRALFAGGDEGIVRISAASRTVSLDVTSNVPSMPFTAACNGCGGWLASIDPSPGQTVNAPRAVTLTLRDNPDFSNLGNLQLTGGDTNLRLNIVLDDAGDPGSRPSVRQAQPVLQAFDNGDRISSGTWVQIYGENLAPRECAQGCDWSQSFNGSQAPTSLNNVEVLIGGKRAYIWYLNPSQINAQVPDDLPDGNVSLQVVVNGLTSNEVVVQKQRVSPALLQWNPNGGTSYLRAILPGTAEDGLSLLYAGPAGYLPGVHFRPARPGDVLTVYAVGCGTTTPASPAGQIVQSTPTGAPPLAGGVEFTFGDNPATPSANVQGFLVVRNIGLCQLSVTVPDLLPGEYRVNARIDGVASNQTLVTLIGP